METHLEIIGTGSYLPEGIITNSCFAGRTINKYDRDGNIVEKKELTEDGIFSVTGIKERRMSVPNEWPSDMGCKAARIAIENAGIDAGSLVGIILASVTEDVDFPSGAVKIQKKLGVRNCFAYDIANACAGFPEALIQANSRVLKRPGNYLVVASECLTKITDYADINSTLFGDGAGAAVLRPIEEQLGIIEEYSASDPFDEKDYWIFRDKKGYLRMPEGQSVMREAVRKMLDSVRLLKEGLKWEKAEVYIPHQANARILAQVESRLSNENAAVYKNIERYGNMSSATCAVALDEALREGVIKRSSNETKGSRVIVTSFGSGLVTSAVAMQF